MTQRATVSRTPRPRTAGAVACAVLTVVGLGAAAAPAAALTLSGTKVKTLPATSASSSDSEVTADGKTTDVIYYFDLHAAAAYDERFSIRLQPGRMATRGGRPEGEALDGPMQFTLYGPGAVGEVVTDPAFREPCSQRESAFHGYATGPARADVWLPASADTTLAVRYSTGRRALWEDTDLRLRYSFVQGLVGGYDPGSLFVTGPVTPVDGVSGGRTAKIPVEAGKGKSARIGAHLLLSPSPSGTWGEEKTPRSIKRGQAVRVKGSLLPKLSGKKVKLRWSSRGGKRMQTAATLKTDKRGKFSATIKAPSSSGVRELWAEYPSQSGELAPDSTSCPISYRVK